MSWLRASCTRPLIKTAVTWDSQFSSAPSAWWDRIAFRAAIVILLGLGCLPRPAEAAQQTLELAVVINGYSVGQIGEFVMRKDIVMARRSELATLGIKVPAARLITLESDDLIDLSTLPGLTWHIDQSTQTINLKAADSRLLPSTLQIERGLRGGPVESGTGATFDYDVSGISAGGQNVVTGALDLRIFSLYGILSSGALIYVGGGPAGQGTTSAVRLDSTYTFSDPNTLRQYHAGDLITGALSSSRAIRLGGVQVSSDFGLRPDLITFPLPTIRGSAAVPSTVDVLVNSNRVLSHQIAAGPFEIPRLPVVTGAGTVSMTVTNALGQQVLVTLPFYASSALLAPGLQSYSAQLGAVRRNWGVESNDYGAFAAVVNYRRGLSPILTVEANLEGTARNLTGGEGAVINVGNFAVLNTYTAESLSYGRLGGQISAGIQRVSSPFSFGLAATFSSHGFRDVAAVNGDVIARLQINANAALSLGRFGSLGIAYAGIERDSASIPVRTYLPPETLSGGNVSGAGGNAYFQEAQRSRVVTASYSAQVFGLAFYATGFRDFAVHNSSGLLFGVTLPLGTRSSASANYGTGPNGNFGQVQVSQSPVAINDWGYQAYASTNGRTAHEFGQLQYKSPYGLLTGGADQTGGQVSWTLEAQGSLSFADGRLFPSNTIFDSFAIVDTNGLANVRVLNENREVGRTNSAGRLLVPNLRSFDINRLAIDPSDIPQDTTADVVTREVRPQDRSGVVVKFPVKVSHGALLRLVDQAGVPIPLGSIVTLIGTDEVVPIGFDGEAYVENLKPHNSVVVERPDGRRCEVSVEYKPVPGEIPSIGPLLCL